MGPREKDCTVATSQAVSQQQSACAQASQALPPPCPLPLAASGPLHGPVCTLLSSSLSSSGSEPPTTLATAPLPSPTLRIEVLLPRTTPTLHQVKCLPTPHTTAGGDEHPKGPSHCPPGPRGQGERPDGRVTGAGLAPQPGAHPGGRPIWSRPAEVAVPCLPLLTQLLPTARLRAWGLLRWDGGGNGGGRQESAGQGRDTEGPGIPGAGRLPSWGQVSG